MVIDLSEQQLRLSGVVSQTRKRLRFAPPVIVEYLPELSSSERRAVWWSPEEVECMISKASYSAEESRKNKVLVDALDQALRDARRSALLANSHTTDDTIVTMLPADQGLKLWCQYGHSRRGLEKNVSRVHQTTRNNIVKKALSKVVTLSRSVAIAENGAEEIRMAYEKVSRSSVMFAQMIAMADAQAALYPFPQTERRRSSSHAKRTDSMSSISTTTNTILTSNNNIPGSPRQMCLKEVSNQPIDRVK